MRQRHRSGRGGEGVGAKGGRGLRSSRLRAEATHCRAKAWSSCLFTKSPACLICDVFFFFFSAKYALLSSVHLFLVVNVPRGSYASSSSPTSTWSSSMFPSCGRQMIALERNARNKDIQMDGPTDRKIDRWKDTPLNRNIHVALQMPNLSAADAVLGGVPSHLSHACERREWRLRQCT